MPVLVVFTYRILFVGYPFFSKFINELSINDRNFFFVSSIGSEFQ
nr:MAG TPA: hypothetical protein [Caudoviricetes sp.]